MNHLIFGETPDTQTPKRRRLTSGAFVIALLLHVALLAGLIIAARSRLVRVTPGLSQVGIAAFNPGAIGTAGTSAPAAKPAQPVRRASPTRTIESTPVATDDSAASSGQAAGAAGSAGGGSGPVRLGSGEGLTLLKKITPTYPRTMEVARIPGTVVLDAIIHRDGSIGDVNILQSTNAAFSQAAADAVKRWRYSPLPYEGVVTVTVTFTVPR